MSRLSSGCVAEFIGTFALTFFGAGAIILTSQFGAAGSLATVAAAHAIALIVFVTGCGYISGGQFNPAVAIGLVIAGKQTPVRAGVFIVAQLLGAACAAGMLQALLSPDIANGSDVKLGATIGTLTKAGVYPQVVGLEAIATFALMFIVLTTAVDDRAPKLGGLCIGLTVGMCILAIGPLTGASMNPARTFGPAICGNHWDMFPAYIIGPVAGAAVAAIVWRTFWTSKPD